MLGRLISQMLQPSRNAAALCAQGASLFKAQRLKEAAGAFERALRVDGGCVAAHAGLGNALHKLGQPGRALSHLRIAADADPAARDLNLLVAQLQLRSGESAQALMRLEALASAHPIDAEITYFCGLALRDQGLHDAALRRFQELAARHPDHVGAIEALAALRRDAGFIDEAIAAYARVVELRPDHAGAASTLLFHEQYRRHDRAALLRRHLQWAQRFMPSPPPADAARRDKDAQRRLTVGYLSADLNQSSAAPFIEPILKSHDRRGFRVACYSTSSRKDATTLRLRAAADLWRDIQAMDDDAACALIQADEIDILVDLNGHTRGGRLGIFARRAAPVQITYLGYGATTGVAQMDYRITDSRLDPPGESERFYVERLVRLPRTMWCFSAPAGMPPVAPLPAAGSGRITFASLNNFAKVSDETLRVWGRILARLPAARLVMVGVPDGSARRRVIGSLDVQGVDPSRVGFHTRLRIEDYLALHAQIDIALDPFPYSGGATTCHALWMGVPVLTLEGDTVLARSGASILHAAGLDDWIVASVEAYEERACLLAGHLPALADLRARLRERVSRSPLCAVADFIAALEACYREAWSSWCRTA
jgi:predicted O-linked N-acetylglucosamine transferase (SPINDLY family)